MSGPQRMTALPVAPVAFPGPQAVHSIDSGISPTSAHVSAHKNHCSVGGESISCGTGWSKHDEWSSPVFTGYGTEMWPTSGVASNGNSMRATVKICRDRPWFHGGDVCSAPRHGGFTS